VTRAAIINAFDPETYKGGIETFIGNLKELLMQHMLIVDIHYLVPQPTLPVKPFPVTFLHNKIPKLILNCFMMGRAFSKIEKTYDLVITNNFYGLGYFAPRVRSFNIYHSSHAAYADALKGKISDLDYRDLKLYFGHIGDRMSGRKKNKIAVSQSVNEELRRYYGFNEITVVNHGIDTDFFRKIEETISLRQKWDIPSDAFVGIFVGRWETGKGTDILEEVIKIHHDVLWVLVIGDSECPLSSENIKIIKNADRESLRELYSLSDFMLFPSYYEGFGLVIIEAMACKLPVICTKVGVAKDLFRFDSLRELILPDCGSHGKIREIQNRISFLKNNSHKIKEISIMERAIIEESYTLDIWRKKMAVAFGLLN
jgi:glycosyltransferase involved in cell wall biosynthesis